MGVAEPQLLGDVVPVSRRQVFLVKKTFLQLIDLMIGEGCPRFASLLRARPMSQRSQGVATYQFEMKKRQRGSIKREEESMTVTSSYPSSLHNLIYPSIHLATFTSIPTGFTPLSLAILPVIHLSIPLREVGCSAGVECDAGEG